jgi:hypothetical protein
MKKPSRFVVMWDCNGLEAVEQLPDDAETTFALLKGTEPPKPQFNIMHWRLRAQFNSQRHYEIYVFEATKGITTEDIRDMFEASPQTAADTIRRIGTVFHSDRQTQKAAIV